jgi:hypothetical protein
MRGGTDVWGPDQLKILQQIFDSVWIQIREEPQFKSVEEEMLRRHVSRRVMAYAEADVLDVNAIRGRVLRSLAASGIATDH